MAMKSLSGFGVELKRITYKDKLDWLINFNDCENLWKAQPTYLISQSVFAIGGLITLLHALRRGGRWPWLWLTGLFYGFIIEACCFNLPGSDIFWHSQTPIMLLGHRIPLHIILAYPTILYAASYSVSRLQLPGWSEPFAVGLMTNLFILPVEMVGVKFLFKTWHDTNPILSDRNYWVPWSFYMLNAIFSFTITFWFHLSYYMFKKDTEKWQNRGFFREFRNFIMASVLGMPTSVIIFDILNHPMNTNLNIHSEVVYFVILVIFIMFTWSGDRTHRDRISIRVGAFDWLLILFTVAHFVTYLVMIIVGHPEKEVSMGLHEPIGPCGETVMQNSMFEKSSKYRKYLCITDYDEDYFTFACLGQKKPAIGALWYTICGTPFKNRNEYIIIVGTICLTALVLFYNVYFRDCNDNKSKNVKDAKKSKQKTA